METQQTATKLLSAGIDINIDPRNYTYIALALSAPIVIYFVLTVIIHKYAKP